MITTDDRGEESRAWVQAGWVRVGQERGRAREENEAERKMEKRKTGREMRGRRARCAMQSSLLLFCDALSIFYTNGVHFSWTNFRRTQESGRGSMTIEKVRKAALAHRPSSITRRAINTLTRTLLHCTRMINTHTDTDTYINIYININIHAYK